MVRDTDTIKTETFTVNTDSLKILGNEPVPSEIIRDLLKQEWQDHGEQTSLPEIHVLNDVTFPGQGNLRDKDWIIIDMVAWEESQRGFTYEFKDMEIPIILHIHTAKSRQRLYNVMAEVRRIIYKNNRTVQPFHLMYWDSFQEDSDGRNKNWQGDCNIRLTSQGVPVFKGSVAGMGSENLPENQR